MTFDFFFSQMTRLTKVFGEKSYASERTDIIWNSVRNLSDNWFERSITNLISNSRYAPLPGEIIELSNIEKHHFNAELKEIFGSCGRCENGIVWTESHLPLISPSVSKCNCRHGAMRTENWPTNDGPSGAA